MISGSLGLEYRPPSVVSEGYEREKMLNRAAVFCTPSPNVRPWCRHRPLSHYGIAHFRRELITLYITNCRKVTIATPMRNSKDKPGIRISHWPIFERTSPSRSVFDLTNRANHGPKTSPHRKGRYTAPDDCCECTRKSQKRS
jgi:hypothetical protein